MDTQAIAERPAHVQGPGVCGNDLETVPWTSSSVFGLQDGRLFGVRSTSPELHAVLDHLLAAHRVDAPPVPALFSVRVAPPGKRRGAPLHHLYHGGQVAIGTRDLARLVRALLLHVDETLTAEPAGLRVNATAVARPGGEVALAPQELQRMSKQVDKHLTAAGTVLGDVPRLLVDPVDGTVAVPPAQHVPDPDALDVDALRALGPSAVESWLPAGPRPLTAWWLAAPGSEPGRLRGAAAVAAITSSVAPPYSAGAASVLADAQALAARVPVTAVRWATQDDLVEAVAALAV